MYKFCGYIVFIILFCLSFVAFMPLNDYMKRQNLFKGYEYLLDRSEESNEKQIIDDGNVENTVDKIEDENILNSQKDTLDFNREIQDILNNFIFDLKSFKLKEAAQYLSKPEFTSQENSIMYLMEYNSEFSFFKTYLTNYKTGITDIKQDGERASALLRIERYDINRLHRKLIEQQGEEKTDDRKLTEEDYEENLYLNEKFFSDEFFKSSVPVKEDLYTIDFVFQDGEWKIINNDKLTNAIVDLDFMIIKFTEN